ncbi:MAG TPA: hypothetical protein VH414_21895 [Lichenihabitans sp.]|jgi:hypothetical protein|nr:hypothetical protein [Lichenihabitans sp.]
MANLSGTRPFDNDTSEKLTGDEIAMLAFVGIVTFTGVGVLLWTLGRALQDMLMGWHW